MRAILLLAALLLVLAAVLQMRVNMNTAIQNMDAQLTSIEAKLLPIERTVQCMDFCKYNGGFKFYWELSEYPCECGNGIRADFEVEQ